MAYYRPQTFTEIASTLPKIHHKSNQLRNKVHLLHIIHNLYPARQGFHQ